MCVWVGELVGGWERACVCVHIVIVFSLYLSGFLAPCFIELLMF